MSKFFGPKERVSEKGLHFESGGTDTFQNFHVVNPAMSNLIISVINLAIRFL